MDRNASQWTQPVQTQPTPLYPSLLSPSLQTENIYPQSGQIQNHQNLQHFLIPHQPLYQFPNSENSIKNAEDQLKISMTVYRLIALGLFPIVFSRLVYVIIDWVRYMHPGYPYRLIVLLLLLLLSAIDLIFMGKFQPGYNFKFYFLLIVKNLVFDIIAIYIDFVNHFRKKVTSESDHVEDSDYLVLLLIGAYMSHHIIVFSTAFKVHKHSKEVEKLKARSYQNMGLMNTYVQGVGFQPVMGIPC